MHMAPFKLRQLASCIWLIICVCSSLANPSPSRSSSPGHPPTSSPQANNAISFLRLDGDLYVSTMDPLLALYDRVSPGGLIYVDDYGR